MSEVTYPRKIRITAYMTTGEVIEGTPTTIRNANDEAHWAKVLRAPKEMGHLALAQTNAFGDVDSIYINPTYITHIRLADVQE
jgi:hypothetical protein